MNKPLCKDPKHNASALYFCKNCAAGQKIADSLFCQGCCPEQKDKHKMHSYEKKQMMSSQFEKMYTEFKEKLVFQARNEFFQEYKKIHPGKKISEYKAIYE